MVINRTYLRNTTKMEWPTLTRDATALAGTSAGLAKPAEVSANPWPMIAIVVSDPSPLI